MKVLIAGGRGFLGSALRITLQSAGHEVWNLSRTRTPGPHTIAWDGTARGMWTECLNDMDAVVNACGYGLQHWPWTASQKRRFLSSRVGPGHALTTAIAEAKRRPSIFMQYSGVNHYGLRAKPAADETEPPADDFLADLTVRWEASTESVQDLGLRRLVIRNAIVLDGRHGLFPLMCLPAKLYAGGRLGRGTQVVPWIHLSDHVAALLFLLQDPNAAGAYNLVAPAPTTNEEFMRAVCKTLHRPFWFHPPAFLLTAALGEMAQLVLEGRAGVPRRLQEAGFSFAFPTIEAALADLCG